MKRFRILAIPAILLLLSIGTGATLAYLIRQMPREGGKSRSLKPGELQEMALRSMEIGYLCREKGLALETCKAGLKAVP